MLIRKKHNLLFISILVLTLLLADISYASRGGGRSRGSIRSGRSGITTRQSSTTGSRQRSFDSRRDSSDFSRRRSFDSRQRSFDSRGKFDNNRFDNDRNFKRDSSFRHSRTRRPYADSISPNAWRFNNQEKPVYKNVPTYRTYRPPAVLSDPRVSGRDYRSRSYLDFRYGKDFNRSRFHYDYRYRRYPLARHDHRFRKGSPFYGFRYDRFNKYGGNPYFYNRYFPYRMSGWPYFYNSYLPGYGYGYYGSSYYGSGYYGSGDYYSRYDRHDSPITHYEGRKTADMHYPKRYIFVSLTGYWPGYNDYRYYDYGTYPYFWYMVSSSPYQPNQPYPPTGSRYDNENPYTYGSDDVEAFASITEPDSKTSADLYFEKGVNAFAAGNYRQAEVFFHQAKNSEPSDVILPFAYVQALFAQGEYEKASRQLREIIRRQPVGKEWVFYPRGLYTDDQILMNQIDQLISKASDNTDMQLLAGYQLLGVQKLELAMEYLNKAQAGDRFNQIAVGKLMYVLNNLKTNYEVKNSDSEYLYK